MPTTITIADPRPRTSRIVLDLSDPYRYRIKIQREVVEETTDTLDVLRRSATRMITREIVFDKQTDQPTGDAGLIALLTPIQQVITALEQEDITAEQAAEAEHRAKIAAAEAAAAERAAALEAARQEAAAAEAARLAALNNEG